MKRAFQIRVLSSEDSIPKIWCCLLKIAFQNVDVMIQSSEESIRFQSRVLSSEESIPM